jgi:hypothetical protein
LAKGREADSVRIIVSRDRYRKVVLVGGSIYSVCLLLIGLVLAIKAMTAWATIAVVCGIFAWIAARAFRLD